MALHAKTFAAHVSGIAERGVGVAARRAQRQRVIAAVLFEQQCRAGARNGGTGHRRQRLDFTFDCSRGSFRQRRTVGDHNRERFTKVAHLVARQNGLLETLQLRPRVHAQRDDRQCCVEIGGGDDSVYAGVRTRSGGVQRADMAVRVHAAQDHRMQHAGAYEIADETAAAGDEACVFDACDCLADMRVVAVHLQIRPLDKSGDRFFKFIQVKRRPAR